MPSFIPSRELRDLRFSHSKKTISTIMSEHVDNVDKENLFILPDAQRDPTKGWSTQQRQEYIESLRFKLTEDQNWLLNVVTSASTDVYELLDAGHRLETVKMFDRSELPALDGRYLKDMSKKEISYWKNQVSINLCFYYDLTDEHKQILFNRRNQGLTMCDGEQLNSRLFTSPFVKYLKYELLPLFEISLTRVTSTANEREKEFFTLFRLVTRILNPGTTPKSNKDIIEKSLPECEKLMTQPYWNSKKTEIEKFLHALFDAFDRRVKYTADQCTKRSADGRRELKEKNLYQITELYVVLDWFMSNFEFVQNFVNADPTTHKEIFKSAVQEFLLIGWKGLESSDKTLWCEKWSHGADCGRNVDHSVKKSAAFKEWLTENFESFLKTNHKSTVAPKKRLSLFRLG
ncbi:hypothetical protein DSLPV1_168 [Dishui lake phycodnavirus 1]|uniref:hypothetical protein n=1 Tax=Dishui lake phycodnavirus 1 TaxID=2079134 RepID=UPI000CD6C401|nr:hypothetical protein C5Y57_gp168 [Dishui lake phycodnavirus 1]AUT19139.1 hypothetical protein DSLPV1_168 [Dishui lake phycodnavirus 1]